MWRVGVSNLGPIARVRWTTNTPVTGPAAGNRGIGGLIFLIFLQKNNNIIYDLVLEPSQQDGSNEGHSMCLHWEIRKILLNFSCNPYHLEL